MLLDQLQWDPLQLNTCGGIVSSNAASLRSKEVSRTSDHSGGGLALSYNGTCSKLLLANRM